jgi:uncharacterized protein (DUF2267 family)
LDFAEKAAVSVLCSLEQRILGEEASDLEAQLPRKLRELMAHCGRHAGLPSRKFGRAELLRTVSHELGVDPATAEETAHAVFSTVAERVSAHEVGQVIHQLPRDLRKLWPPQEELAEEAKAEAARGRPRGREAREAAGRTALRQPAREAVDAVLGMPMDAQLGVLRTLAPKILARLDVREQEGFLRDLAGELARAERGQPSYNLKS